MKPILIAMGLLAMAGCNTYDVRAMKFDPDLKEVVVINNPNVRVWDFDFELVDAFKEHGLAVRQEAIGYQAAKGEWVVSYTAQQVWDVTDYLSDAMVSVNRDRQQEAYGRYHHIGGAMSFSFWKWQCTKTKMAPLYDELLKNYPKK